MICKFCREDLPIDKFRAEDYEAARKRLKWPTCLTCFKNGYMSKKQRREAKREIMRQLHTNDRQEAWKYSNQEQKTALQYAGRTKWELRLDEALRAEAIEFVPQHPFQCYWLDFAFIEQKMAVEIDGAVHLTEKAKKHDKKRTNVLTSHGWIVIRFTNAEVQKDIAGVVKKIKMNLIGRKSGRALGGTIEIVCIPPKI